MQDRELVLTLHLGWLSQHKDNMATSNSSQRSQIPSKFEFLGRDQKITQPWQFWLQGLEQGLAPIGSGYVVDNTASLTGPTSISQGLASNRGGTPAVNSIYIADDNGAIYTVSGGQWQIQTPAFTGDVLKPAFSTTTTLATVNLAPGTYGTGTLVPSITVDAKGRVTTIGLVPVESAPLPGTVGDFIFKADSAGHPGADSLYSQSTYTITRKLAFHQSDASPILMCALQGNAVVTKVELTILDAFDGTSPTVKVGTNTPTFDDLMDTIDNNPMILSNWTVEPGTKYTTPQSVYVSISAGSGSAGYAMIVLTIVQL